MDRTGSNRRLFLIDLVVYGCAISGFILLLTLVGTFLLPGIPVTGYCELNNGQKIEHAHGLRFAQDVCELNYTDEAGFDITSSKGSLQNYINLTPGLNLMWQDGDLAMYVLDGKTWKPCDAYWVADGDHGRLACRTDNVGKFSLVDTSVKVEEEE